MRTMNKLVDSFWKRFTDTRTETLAVISDKTGIPLATMKGWNSKGRLPKLTEAIKLSEYLNVSLDWLVMGKAVEKGSSESLDKLVSAYLKADEQTKYVVNRILDI